MLENILIFTLLIIGITGACIVSAYKTKKEAEYHIAMKIIENNFEKEMKELKHQREKESKENENKSSSNSM